MLTPRLYIDTTVPSALLDARTPDRQRLTRQFWEQRLHDFEAVISMVVLREIDDTPDTDKRDAMRSVVGSFGVLDISEEADDLAGVYVERGVFTERYRADALHVAIAVVNGAQYFASWNFSHLVKIATRRQVNLINALRGYGGIEIAVPPEL